MNTKPSDSSAVDAYMQALTHPLAELAAEVRRTILAADPSIGEEVKWNAPAFFYTGAMEPFDPKEYRRHLIVFNFYRKDCIRLVFWRGDRANDKSGLLEGTYADGRRIATLSSIKELRSRQTTLVAVIRSQLRNLRRYEKKKKTA
jgi:hypothetical protein